MVSLQKWLSVLFLGGILSAAAQAGVPNPCNVSEFTAGGSSANSCQVRNTPNDNVADVNAQFGAGFTFGAKYDTDTGLDTGSIIDLLVTAALEGSGFNWSIPDIPFRDAAGAGLAFAFLSSLLVLVRERQSRESVNERNCSSECIGSANPF